MFRSDRALDNATNNPVDITGRSDADAFADRFTFARAQADGSAVFMHTRESTLSDFINGLCKILLALSVLGLVLAASVFAINRIDFRAQAETAGAVSGQEIDALRSGIASLKHEQSVLRSQLALLTEEGGVLARLVERFQKQRRVNGAHSNAIRQLYSTTGLIGASLPSLEEQARGSETGSRPVQVTPVSLEQDDRPKRVVVTPQPETMSASARTPRPALAHAKDSDR